MRNNNNTLNQNHNMNFYMGKIKRVMYPTFLVLFFILGIFGVSWGQTPGSIGFGVNCVDGTSVPICENAGTYPIIESCGPAMCTPAGDSTYCWYINSQPVLRPSGYVTKDTLHTDASMFASPGTYNFKRCYSCGTDPCNDQTAANCSDEVMVVVTPIMTVDPPSTNTTVCLGTVITPEINISTTRATGIQSTTTNYGLPAGVTATFSGNTSQGMITISGTPTTATGSPFNYTIPLTGGCGTVSATGTITVTPSITGNTSGMPISICTGSSAILTGGTLTGGSGIYDYLWESSTNNINWGNAEGMNNTANYTTVNLTSSTYFRRTVTSGGCINIAQSALVTVTATVGTPTAITVSAGTEPTCQLTNGTTTTTYATTATNSTSFNWAVTPVAGTINTTSGEMTWANGYLGTATISVTADGCNGPSTEVTRSVTVSPISAVGPVSNNQNICTETQPNDISISSATGTIQWQWANKVDFMNPNNIGTNSTTLPGSTIGALTSSRYFRAVVKSGACDEIISSIITITVNPASAVGTVSDIQNICTGTQPYDISISNATGTIQWQWANDVAFTSPNNIGANSTILSGSTIGNLTSSRYFRTVVTNSVCPSVTSNIISVIVSPISTVGSVSSNQSICDNVQPADISIASATGTIQWQWSSDLAFTSPNNIGLNSTTLQGSTIGKLASTKYYRAVVKSGTCSEVISATSTISVAPQPTAGAITINGGNNPQGICAKNNVSATFGQGTGGFNPTNAKREYKIGSDPYQEYTEAINTDNLEVTGGSITFRSTFSTAGIGCNTSTIEKPITIHLLPQPIIDVQESSSNAYNDGKICSGDMVTLTASSKNGGSGLQYQWNTGETSAAISRNPIYNGGPQTYTVTIKNSYNCSKEQNYPITVYDIPKAQIEYQSIFSPLKFEREFTLTGVNEKVEQTGNRYKWDFNIPLQRLFLNNNSLDSKDLNNLKINYNQQNPERVNANLKVTNNNSCVDEENYEIYLELASNCDIEITNLKKEVCVDQNSIIFNIKKIVPVDNASISNAKAIISKGTIKGFDNNKENLVQIDFNGAGKYIFDLEFKTDLMDTCPNPKRRDSILVFDKPSIQSLSQSLDTICADGIDGFNFKVIFNKQQFVHNRNIKLTYNINGNDEDSAVGLDSIIIQISKDKFKNTGINIINIISLEYIGFECKSTSNQNISVFKINSCDCENLVSGGDFASQVKLSKSDYCKSDSLEYYIEKIDFDPSQEPSISNPKVKVVFSTDISGVPQLFTTPEFDLKPNTVNDNVKGKLDLRSSSFPINKLIYVNYFVAPKGDFSTCSIKKSTQSQFIIRYSPLPVLNDVTTALCDNSSLIPIPFVGDLNGNPDLPINYDWQSNNVNSPAQNGYLSIAKNILVSEIQITLTQKNKYGSLTCKGEVSRIYSINTSSSAPDRSTIARYPGHVYFLEDTTANLCVQWGIANDNTFNNVTSLDSVTTPKVSKNGYAVFGNPSLTGELEKLEKYLWADTWFKAGNTCGVVTEAECVTRTYYNASLPPKGAPRSTPDNYQAVIYPNPSTGQFTLALQGDWADTFTVDLLDYTGRQVAQLGQIDKALYKAESTIDVQDVLPGLYLLRVIGTDGLTRIHKVTIY